MDALTDDAGQVIQRMSFDAFGQRRDPSNWSDDLTATQIASLKDDTDRGYTDQEQLDTVGLIHMNGRVYDPMAGRFISADPTVPYPFRSQSFNRYAYVENNPLAYVDPSGYTLYVTITCPSNPNGPGPCAPKSNESGGGGNPNFDPWGDPVGDNYAQFTILTGGSFLSGPNGAPRGPEFGDGRSSRRRYMATLSNRPQAQWPSMDSILEGSAYTAATVGNWSELNKQIVSFKVNSAITSLNEMPDSAFNSLLTQVDLAKGWEVFGRRIFFVGSGITAMQIAHDWHEGQYSNVAQDVLDGTFSVVGEFGGPIGLGISIGYFGLRESGTFQGAGDWLASFQQKWPRKTEQ